jgi:hypothetical protein
MGFARTHKRLMLVLLLIDLAGVIALQWAPFDPPAGSNPAKNIAGEISLCLNMAGYFFALFLRLNRVPMLFYVTILAVTYFELVLLAMAFTGLRRLVKKPSPR